MRSALAIGASEALHGGGHPALACHAGEGAFGDGIGIGFEGADVVRFFDQVIHMPLQGLVPPQVPGQPLVQACHGAARVAVCSFREMEGAEGSDADIAVGTQGDYEDVRPLSDVHADERFLSSSSTCERVLMRTTMLLSSIFDGEMSAISPSLLP